MDFDPSSAEPVSAAVAEPEFDPQSATLAAAPTPPKNLEIKPGEIGPGMTAEDVSFMRDINAPIGKGGSFQQKYLEPKAREALSGVDLPNAPEIPATADPTGGGRALAALYQGGVKPLVSAITAPINLALAPIGIAEAGGSIIAKTVSKAAQAYFAGDLAKAGGEKAAKVVEVAHDPNASTQDLMTALVDAGSTLGFAGLLAGHAAGVKLGEQPVKMEVKRPNGSTVEVETTAAQAERQIKTQLDTLNSELDSVYKQAGVERKTEVKEAAKPEPAFDPVSAESLVKQESFVAETAKALAPEPPPEVQFTVQRPQPHPETGQEIPGYVQVETKTNEGRGEPMTPEQRAQYPTPEEVLSTDLPTGQHTLDEVRSAIAAKNEPLEVTSTKNAQVEREREARGIEAADQAVSRDFPELKAQAEEIIKNNPEAGQKLVSELKDNPRPITDVENAVLLHRQVQLQNEFRDTPLSDRSAIDRISDELTDIYNAGKGTGTELGAGLNARKMAVAEDFTLANLVTLRRAAKGTRLTPEELKATADLHRKIEDLQKQYDDLKASKSEAAPAKRSRIVQTLSDRADAARERLKARIQSGQVSAGIDPTILKDYAEIAAYHLARGVEAGAELIKEFGEKIKEHIPAILEQAKSLRAEAEAEKMTAAKLAAYKKRTLKNIVETENKVAIGDLEKTPRKELVKDEEARHLQARLESAKAEFAAALERDRYEKLSALGKLKEQGLNTYDAARNLMTTGEFSFVLRQGAVTAATHPILTAKAIPTTVKALFSDEIGARALDLQTFNKPEVAAARAAKLHLVEEGAKLSRQEEIFASKWAEKIPGLRNFNQAGRVFLNKVRFDVWKVLREQAPEITPERDHQVAMFVNEATGRGTLGPAEPIAVALGRALFSPRYLASRIQLLVGHSMWGGDFVTRKIIAKEYAKVLVAAGVYYTLMGQMKDKNKKPATIEKNPLSSDFGKVKIGNTRVDPLAGMAQVITLAARLGTASTKNSKGKVSSLRDPSFGKTDAADVAGRFARSKLHPVPGALYNLYKGTDLGGNEATIANQSVNFVMPLTYVDIYQALQEQDVPEGASISLLTLLGQGLQTYDANKKRPKPQSPNKN